MAPVNEPSTRPIDQTERRAASVAGVASLTSYAIVVAVNFGIFPRLFVRGDAPATVRNILANQALFRLGIAGNLLYCVGVVVLASSLYVVLRPAGRNLALFAAVGRTIHGVTWLAMTLNLFTALRLVVDPAYARALGADQVAALVRLNIGWHDAYYAGLLFLALAATANAGLWLRSRYIPRGFAAFGVGASAWCVGCTLVYYLAPGFTNVVSLSWFDSPMALFELALAVWLLTKGLATRSPTEATP
jgi:hypothetical protein